MTQTLADLAAEKGENIRFECMKEKFIETLWNERIKMIDRCEQENTEICEVEEALLSCQGETRVLSKRLDAARKGFTAAPRTKDEAKNILRREIQKLKESPKVERVHFRRGMLTVKTKVLYCTDPSTGIEH